MIVIAFRFLAGSRYHSTAWGNHANEGVPEWPPSSWRILRALIATARLKGGGPTHAENPALRSLIEALAAAQPPRYVLPAAAAAHTRHFMPLADGSRTKIFDTFVQPRDDDALFAIWDASLPAEQRHYLGELLAKINYLGRCESLVEAELVDPVPEITRRINCRPAMEGEPLQRDEATFKLLAPLSAPDYAAWHTARAANKRETSRSSKRSRDSDSPPGLLEALETDTATWRDAGWSQPPGSRWLEYIRPASPFRLAAPPRLRIACSEGHALPTVARYAVESPVPEPITRALSLGERFHTALCSRSNGLPVFTGKQGGVPLAGHDHAFYMPECDERGRVTHVTVFAPCGFDHSARDALRSLRGTWARRSAGLKLILIGIGQANEFPDCPFFKTASRWMSLTPFVPVRHLKRRHNGSPKIDPANGLPFGSPEHDLRRLLAMREYPAPVSVRPLRTPVLEAREIRWLAFQRERRNGNGTANCAHSGHGFAIEFPQPVQGPLALGYAAHFGLGLFVPAG